MTLDIVGTLELIFVDTPVKGRDVSSLYASLNKRLWYQV